MYNKFELREQRKFIDWAESQGCEVYSIPMSTFTTSWRSLKENKSAGVRKGVSDMIVFLPAKFSLTDKTHLFFIELKKDPKDGKAYASKEQKAFLALVDSVAGSVHGAVCHGCKEAIAFIQPLVDDEALRVESDQWAKDNNLI